LRLVAAVGSLGEARAALDRALPDVLLTDLGLPDGDGIDLVRSLRERQARTLPMVITVFGDEQHVIAAIEAGRLGYLLHDGPPWSRTDRPPPSARRSWRWSRAAHRSARRSRATS